MKFSTFLRCFSFFCFVLLYWKKKKKKSHGKYVWGEKDLRDKSTGAAKTEITFCRVHTGRSKREIRVCARGRHTTLNDGRNESGIFTLLLEIQWTYAFPFCRLGVAGSWSNPMPTIKL